MKGVISALVCMGMTGFAVFGAGCAPKGASVKVLVDPSFKAGNIERIAVFPFTSTLSVTDDPYDLAPKTLDPLFQTALEQRTDYEWMSPASVGYAVDRDGLREDAARVVEGWRKKHKADAEIIAKIATALGVDGIMFGVVDLWQKDEADSREKSSASISYVGATVTVFDGDSGHMLFEVSCEDKLEAFRGENREMWVARSVGGLVQSDRTDDIYKAPPLEEVAVKVAQSLAESIPSK